MNKRPPGTRVLTAKEHKNTLATLNRCKSELNEGIEQMSVTLYTTRAQNQMRGFQQRMEQVDQALKVFDRNRVIVKDWHLIQII